MAPASAGQSDPGGGGRPADRGPSRSGAPRRHGAQPRDSRTLRRRRLGAALSASECEGAVERRRGQLRLEQLPDRGTARRPGVAPLALPPARGGGEPIPIRADGHPDGFLPGASGLVRRRYATPARSPRFQRRALRPRGDLEPSRRRDDVGPLARTLRPPRSPPVGGSPGVDGRRGRL